MDATDCNLQDLPNEIVTIIAQFVIRSTLLSQRAVMFNSLMHVSTQLAAITPRTMKYLPRIYYPHGSPGIYSIRKLLFANGAGSGLMLELKFIINNSRWQHAWIQLQESQLGWFYITSLWWK